MTDIQQLYLLVAIIVGGVGSMTAGLAYLVHRQNEYRRGNRR